MTAELVRGQNHPLPTTRLEIRVSAGHPVVACGRCSRRAGRPCTRSGSPIPVRPLSPASRSPGRPPQLPASPSTWSAVPAAVHQVQRAARAARRHRRPGPVRRHRRPLRSRSSADDGTEVASFTITGLDTETAVVAVELYRRQGAWKVRAMGQGYAGGLAQLLGDQGLVHAHEKAAEIQRTAVPRTPRTEPAPAEQQGCRRRPRPARRAPVPATGPGPGRGCAVRCRNRFLRRPAAHHPRRAAGIGRTHRLRAPAPPLRAAATAPGRAGPAGAGTVRAARSRATPPAGPWRSASTTRSGGCSRTWPAPSPPTAVPSTSPSPAWTRSSTRPCPTRAAASAATGDAARRPPAPSASELTAPGTPGARPRPRPAGRRVRGRRARAAACLRPLGQPRLARLPACPWRSRWRCASAISSCPRRRSCASRCWSGCRWSAGCGSTAAVPAPRPR